jgi:cytochrome c oxidase assembly factor CtaG
MIATSLPWLLALTSALYAAGVVRVWRAAGAGRGVTMPQAAAFTAACVSLVVALYSPLAEWSEHSFAAHMVQHELLMIVAAPLMAWSAFGVAIAWATGASRRALRLVNRGGHHVRFPGAALACLVHAAALWIWHAPRLFDTALAHQDIHALQHLSFFATGTWFWWSLSHSSFGRLGFGPAVVYLFATTVQSGALGALLVVSPRILYPPQTAGGAAFGFSALQDQQLAGLLMWVPASLIFVAAGLLYLAGWLKESERRVRIFERRASGASRT